MSQPSSETNTTRVLVAVAFAAVILMSKPENRTMGCPSNLLGTRPSILKPSAMSCMLMANWFGPFRMNRSDVSVDAVLPSPLRNWKSANPAGTTPFMKSFAQSWEIVGGRVDRPPE